MGFAKRWAVGLVILIGLSGCANLVQPTASPLASPLTASSVSPLTTPASVILIYQRVGGIGGLDETWTIEGNGRVIHSGRGAGADGQLTPDQVAQLIGAIRAIQAAGLSGSYVPQDTCCDRFTHILTMTLDGQTTAVRTLDAAPAQPALLTELIMTLNQMLK